MRKTDFKSVCSSPIETKVKFPFFSEPSLEYLLEELASKITVEQQDCHNYLITPTHSSITIQEEPIAGTERYVHLFLNHEKIATSIPHMKKTIVYLEPPREEVGPDDDDVGTDFVLI